MKLLVFCLLFTVGMGLYLLKRCAYAIRNPNNAITSRTQFLFKNWDVLLYRAGLDQILFWSWATWPEGLARLLSLSGYHFEFELPLNYVTAVLGGLLAELLLDAVALKVQFLQLVVPPVDGQQASKP